MYGEDRCPDDPRVGPKELEGVQWRRGKSGPVRKKKFVRTLKSALDERMAVKIDTFHPVLTWLCEYAGLLLNRLEVSSDGNTSYERVKGKPAQVIGV